MVTRRDKAASSHSLNKLLHEYRYLHSLETFALGDYYAIPQVPKIPQIPVIVQ